MDFSRRHLLRTGAVAATALSLRSFAAPLPNLRGGEILPDPDFGLLRKTNPFVVGVRPHRKGGVRLELQEAPLGKKLLVHNYGHGGGGITLSWGCASVAVELVDQAIQKLKATNPSPTV